MCKREDLNTSRDITVCQCRADLPLSNHGNRRTVFPLMSLLLVSFFLAFHIMTLYYYHVTDVSDVMRLSDRVAALETWITLHITKEDFNHNLPFPADHSQTPLSGGKDPDLGDGQIPTSTSHSGSPENAPGLGQFATDSNHRRLRRSTDESQEVNRTCCSDLKDRIHSLKRRQKVNKRLLEQKCGGVEEKLEGRIEDLRTNLSKLGQRCRNRVSSVANDSPDEPLKGD